MPVRLDDAGADADPASLWIAAPDPLPARPQRGGFTLEALASWLFDRELFQGTNFVSGRTDVVQFDPGLGLSVQLLRRR